MKLTGQIALVTGGSRGIGRATALAFATEGADIAFCHLNDDAKADETAADGVGLAGVACGFPSPQAGGVAGDDGGALVF